MTNFMCEAEKGLRVIKGLQNFLSKANLLSGSFFSKEGMNYDIDICFL